MASTREGDNPFYIMEIISFLRGDNFHRLWRLSEQGEQGISMKILAEIFGNRRFLLYLCTINQGSNTEMTDLTDEFQETSRVPRTRMRYARKIHALMCQCVI